MPKSYYPPQSLKKAAVIPRTIFEKNGGKPMFRVTLASELSQKSESRTFRDLITAAAGYGLTEGSYISQKISLQRDGEEVAHGNVDAPYRVLFAVELFKAFYEHFGSSGSRSVPSEKAAKDFLQNEWGVPEAQVDSVLDNILQDMRDWCLLQDIAGGEKFVPIELAKQKMGALQETRDPATIRDGAGQARQIPLKSAEDMGTKPPVDISPKLLLNIEIHIAAETSDEKIEAIFKNMRKYLLNNGD